MSDTKNALAELAEELESLIPKDKEVRELDQRRWNVVDKAQRIVEELAKVDRLTECGDAWFRCCEIAEEGNNK